MSDGSDGRQRKTRGFTVWHQDGVREASVAEYRRDVEAHECVADLVGQRIALTLIARVVI